MIVVGFNWLPVDFCKAMPIERHSAVAAVVDGELVFSSEERRYTRTPYEADAYEIPLESFIAMFKFLKDRYGIKPGNVDAFAVNWDPSSAKYSLDSAISMDYRLHSGGVERLAKAGGEAQSGDPSLDLSRLFLAGIYRKMGTELPKDAKVYLVEHRLAHAASAYYFSGLNSSAVVLTDPGGSNEATTVWKVRNGEFEKSLDLGKENGSITGVYGRVASGLGVQSDALMFLSSYGTRNPEMCERVMSFVGGGAKVPYYFSKRHGEIAGEILEGVNLKWNHNGPMRKDIADVAWCAQDLAEQLMLRVASWVRENTGERNLCFAGKTALDSKVNMRLRKSKLFSDVFVFPDADDSGCPAGAAAYAYEHMLGGKMRCKRLPSARLGPEYDGERVRKVVQRGKWKAKKVDDPSEVAQLVSKGKIVAWFEGRSEIGPRPLGGRSIIADPTTKDSWKAINELKGRRWWRPLAPAVLYQDMRRYFTGPMPAPFMNTMLELNGRGASALPAVCSVDRSTEPQSVRKAENAKWYAMISAFKDIKGEGAVVNANFNLAKEPLVETPEDAIASFSLGGFDALYLDGWLILKK
ncbi:Uncharacterised protein [uncultured archaeon]|nr:Uncharacterised protein [uncultured archaeon]